MKPYPQMSINMKTMSCEQLGGAYETAFRADLPDKITELYKQHGM